MKYKKLTKDELFNHLIKQKKELSKLAEEIDVPFSAVRRWCSSYNLDIRDERIKYYKHGKLKALYKTDRKSSSGKSYYLCECDCGGGCEVLAHDLSKVQSCGCDRLKGKDHHAWKGFGDIPGYYFGQIKEGALSRGLNFEISIEYLWNLFLKQEGKCIFSGHKLAFSYATNKTETTASLDRIDSSLGYIEGNLQWVHKIVNFMKQSLSDREFRQWIASIYKYSLEGKDLWKEIGVKF